MKSLTLGQYSYFDANGSGTIGELSAQLHQIDVIIGKFCSIAAEVKIFEAGNHNTAFITTYPLDDIGLRNKVGLNISQPENRCPTIHKGNTIICNDVWIGYGAILFPGITIADGAVIGAFSVVTKNVEPYTIVGGNPAKLIRKRFSDEDIEFLLKLKWWDWPQNKISEHANILCSSNIDELKKI